MAWYDTSKNGGHKVHGRHEPGYGHGGYPDHEPHPMFLDADGRKHEIIGYTEYHNAQSYMTQTEQVVELRRGGSGGGGGGLGLAGHNLSPRGKDFYKHQSPASKAHLVPWKATSDWPDSGRESSPKAHNQGVISEKAKGGSPRYNTGYIKHNNVNPRYGHTSPPPYSNKPHSSSDDESDDEVCYDGVCYPNPKVGAKPNTHFSDDGYDRKPKVQVSNYSAPPHSYGVPILTQPGKDPYYGKPTKGNTAYSPPYEASHNKHFSGNPPPIKTKPDYTAQQPKFTGPPNGYPTTTIDSSEAKRRYGGVTVPTEQPQYSGTIDCRAAADKYQGVFVRGNNF